MTKLQLQVYVDEEYSYLSDVDPNAKVSTFIRQIEMEMGLIFDASPAVSIYGLQTKERCDVNPEYPVSTVFPPDDFVYVLRSLARYNDPRQGSRSALEPVILEIPGTVRGQGMPPEPSGITSFSPISHEDNHMPNPLTKRAPDIPRIASSTQPNTAPGREPLPVAPLNDARHSPCTPHCTPLAPHGVPDLVCQKCGEMRPYLPIEGQLCTELCVIRSKHGNGYMRKMKSQGLDFCSICISRYRHRKYAARQRHQCLECHRPWLILNENGLCRTCHVRLVGRPTARKRKSHE